MMEHGISRPEMTGRVGVDIKDRTAVGAELNQRTTVRRVLLCYDFLWLGAD